MKIETQHSLRFQMTLLMVFLIICTAALLGYGYKSTIDAIYRETYLSMVGTVSLYSKQLVQNLKSVQWYLVSLYINENIDIGTIVEEHRDTTSWNRAVYRMQNKFITSQSLYHVDGFFLFVPETGLFLTPNASGGVPRNEIISSISSGEWGFPENTGKWILLAPPHSDVLYRAVRFHGYYIGAWIHAPAFLEEIISNPSIALYLSDSSGKLLGSDSLVIEGDSLDEARSSYVFVKVDGTEQMLIAQELPLTNLSLVSLIPSDQLAYSVKNYLPSALFILAAMILLLLIGVTAIHHWILNPLGDLTKAIYDLQDGNWNAVVDDRRSCKEFKAVNDAFNEMVANIRSLKIDIYEEQLNRQTIEMEYLKLQMTPHFLINCLNTICQLTDADNPGLANQMANELCHHIRYTLSSNAIVPLFLEMEHVENYVKLSNIRYHGCLTLRTDLDPNTLSSSVIPLLILNFVENTVKHEVKVGQNIEIHILSKAVIHEGRPYISFLIWDTGSGFSADILEKLQDIEHYVKNNRNQHLGISNVYKRAQLLLGPCEFKFANRINAGAEIRILILDQPYRKEPN